MDKKEEIIATLDEIRNHYHKIAEMRFSEFPSEKDTVFCEACRKANYIAILRRKIYNDEISI